jgi:alpha-L-fucosidase
MSVGERPSGSLTRGKSAKASVSYPSGSAHGPAKALDDDPETRWATPAGTSSVWFEVDLGAPAEIGSLYVDERDWNRVRKFALQVREGENWRTVLGGTSFGADFRRTFDPVTARHVRLNILESTEGPTLWEFRLFPPQR